MPCYSIWLLFLSYPFFSSSRDRKIVTDGSLSRNWIGNTENKKLFFWSTSVCWLSFLKKICVLHPFDLNIWLTLGTKSYYIFCFVMSDIWLQCLDQGRCVWGPGKQWFYSDKTAVMGSLQKGKKKIAACNSNLCRSTKQTESNCRLWKQPSAISLWPTKRESPFRKKK